jgi:hypothetical protein
LQIDWIHCKDFVLEADVLLSPYEILVLFKRLFEIFGIGATNEQYFFMILSCDSEVFCMHLSFDEFQESDLKWYFDWNDGKVIFKNQIDMFYFKLLVN